MNDTTREDSTRFASIIGVNLVLAREAAGVTQHELARLARTSRATIAQIEAGISDPRLSTITSLANALGVSPHLLIAGPEEAARLVDIIDNCHEIIDLAPDDAETEVMETMVQSRLPKENRRGARYAADYVRTRGYATLGSRVGAAVINAHLPGIGAAIGAFFFHTVEDHVMHDVGE